jgi:hypothetical protein
MCETFREMFCETDAKQTSIPQESQSFRLFRETSIKRFIKNPNPVFVDPDPKYRWKEQVRKNVLKFGQQ